MAETSVQYASGKTASPAAALVSRSMRKPTIGSFPWSRRIGVIESPKSLIGVAGVIVQGTSVATNESLMFARLSKMCW